MIATVALAKDLDATGVLLGAMAGNSVATTLAVVSASSLSAYLSPATVSRGGGALFLVFAAAALLKAAGVIEGD
jgi:putative Ca2+/H+ antiporter (TMEM165/GDT1 family)